jgi:hypothetical protein
MIGDGLQGSRPTDHARAALELALGIAAERLGDAQPAYARLLLNYVAFKGKSGHKAEAKGLESRARAVLKTNARGNRATMTIDASELRNER